MDVPGELIPIVMFAAIALILGLYLYFRHRGRESVQETIRQAIEKGHELTPEVLDRLGEPRKAGSRDMRRGIIGLAIGIAIAAFGVLLGEEDAVRPMLAISAFPFVVGIAYLGLWQFSKRSD
jgi:hypothetical protein